MAQSQDRSPAWRRTFRVLLALACAVGAFEASGCVLQKLNKELKSQVNAGVDRMLGVEQIEPDQRLVRQAAEAIDRGDYFEAETQLDSALQINPTSSAAKLNLAAVYEATGRPEQAKQLYAELVRPADDAPVAVVGDEKLSDSDAARIASFRLQRLRQTTIMQPAVYSDDWPSATYSLEAVRSRAAAKKAGASADAPVDVTKKTASIDPAPIATTAISVTLATYRSEAAANTGSADLWTRHETIFGELQPVITEVASTGGKGKAFRLSTGPFGSAREAFEFCEKLQALKVYCVIAG